MLCCQMLNRMPQHIVRLLFLMALLVLLGLAAKAFLTDPSFYKYGDFRADAVPELAAGEPLYRGTAYCQTCHNERSSDWSVSTHSSVECEVCHGANPNHPDDEKTLIPADTIRLCTTCHEAMPARPARQPQIVPGEHPFADEENMPCIECHDPHSPGPVVREDETAIMEPPAASTTEPAFPAPPGASKCAKCHGKQGEGVKKNPALAGLDPAIFIDKMQMYRSGAGDSKIMTRFAKALGDEEITGLAAYYESLPAAHPRLLKE